jgi:hypothetical protein
MNHTPGPGETPMDFGLSEEATSAGIASAFAFFRLQLASLELESQISRTITYTLQNGLRNVARRQISISTDIIKAGA